MILRSMVHERSVKREGGGYQSVLYLPSILNAFHSFPKFAYQENRRLSARDRIWNRRSPDSPVADYCGPAGPGAAIPASAALFCPRKRIAPRENSLGENTKF